MAPTAPSLAHRLRPPGWLVRTVISIGCLVATVWWVSSQPTPKFPTDARAIIVLLGAASLTLSLSVLRGWRWQRILGSVGVRKLGIEPYLLTLVGYMGNTVLPARGGDLMRIGLLARRRKADWKTVAGTLIPERLLDVLALALALVGLSLSGSARSRLGAWPAVISITGIVGVSVVLFVYHELRVRGRFQSFADKARPFTRATRVLISRQGAFLLGLTLGIWAIEGFVLWLVVDASYGPIPYFAAAFVVVLASLATAIPAAPGFIGTLDAAVIFGLQVAGVASSATFALAVLYRIVLFGPITVVGALTLILRYGGLDAIRLRRTSEPPAEEAAPGGPRAAAPGAPAPSEPIETR